MHIVIFVDFHVSSIGGVATSVVAQAEALEAAGHTVTVVCPPPAVKGTGSVLSLVVLPAVPFARPNGFPMVMPGAQADRAVEKALAKRPPIDIVHVQTNMGVGITGVRYAKHHHIPLAQTMHGRDDVFAEATFKFPYVMTLSSRWMHRAYIPHRPHAHLEHESKTARNAWATMVNHARAADHVVMPSRHFADKFRAHGLESDVTVVSNGIREPLIAMLTSIRTKKYAPRTPLQLVWIGRMSVEKRPLETIQAIEKLSDVTLDMYGGGPAIKEARDYVTAHGLEKRVRIHGRMNQDDIVRNLAKHDLMIYPSYGFDNQPMVLLEATVAGIPVIYCDPDLAECMPEDGALLTASPEVKDIRKAIKSLAADRPRLVRMHAAMIAGADAATQTNATRRMIRLYRKLIERP
jgi:glycosyltransferase involved in cell wall biosynthesis